MNNLRTAAFHQHAPLILLPRRGRSHPRLADRTVQPNVEKVLRRVAGEFDRLADDVATDEGDFHHPESLEQS